VLINLFKREPTIIFNLVISAFMLTMLWLGNGKMTIELVLFAIVVSTVLIKAGELILQISRLTAIKAWLPMAFVVGFVAISLPMIALTLIFSLSAFAAFVICALSVLSLTILSSQKVATRPSIEWTDTIISLVLAITIGLLAKIPVSSPATLLNMGVLPIWNDYFIHGVTIASFGSPFASSIDMELAGESRNFYHYAPFMIPAAFQTVSGMAGLALSTSLLLPLGLLIAALGSYSFAVELGGRLGALLALTAIICFPAFSVFIQSGWFDFYWLLFIAPGTGYAIGVSAVVCASTATYLKKNDNYLLWFTILLLFSLILIRAHMFLLLAPAIVSVIFFHRWPANIRLMLWGLISAILSSLLVFHFSAHLHALWIEFANPHTYLNNALQWSPIYGQQIKLFEYPILTIIAQLLIVLVAVLGIYFVLYPLVLSLSVRQFGFNAIDALPLLMLISFIGLMLFAPIASNGDLTEYKHRHFPLLYVIIAIYTITYTVTLATKNISNVNKAKKWMSVLVTCVFATTILLSWGSNPASPNIQAMPWAEGLHNQPITPGLQESAQYMQTHAKPGDVFAMDAASIGTTLSAPIVEVISLSSIPAFISRPELKKMRSQCIREVVTKRLNLIQELSLLDNWPEVQRFLQTNGIRWFLIPAGKNPKWDSSLKFAVFLNNGLAVYDAGQSNSETFKKPKC
jgi:hypothetical protein